MFSADQLIAHAIGDYVLQSDWMAQQKTKRHFAAFAHAVTYSVPFLFLAPSLVAWCVIVASHAAIDRYRLARYVVWAKNWLGPNRPWSECQGTGYPESRPPWMAVWLMIIADNVIHVLINGLALRYL